MKEKLNEEELGKVAGGAIIDGDFIYTYDDEKETYIKARQSDKVVVEMLSEKDLLSKYPTVTSEELHQMRDHDFDYHYE